MEQSLLTLTKLFIDNDPTEKLLKFMAEENQENTKWKWWNWCLAYRILFSKNLRHQYLFITTVLLQVEIHDLFSKFLFIKITSLQKEKETPRIKFLSAMC